MPHLRFLVSAVAPAALVLALIPAASCRDEPVVPVVFPPRDLGRAAPIAAAPPARTDAAPTVERPGAAPSSPVALAPSPPTAPTAPAPAASSPASPSPAGPSAASSDADTRCARDSDCVSVSAGCCDCRAGGKATAVARGAARGYVARLSRRCGPTMCVTVMSNDPSCFRAPACRAGRCVLVDR